jgi:hypothetical protein
MNREIPNLNCSILHPLLGHKDKNRTEEKYIKEIEKFERGCEKSLIETFGRLSIDSMVKTDPYSLPYTHEVVVTLNGESYLNGPYEFHRVVRKIVKEVLDKNLWKIRFYMFVNVLTDQPDQHFLLKRMGQVEYRFRYYIKEGLN